MEKDNIDFSDIPELTPEQLKNGRRVTPEETKRFRQAIIDRMFDRIGEGEKLSGEELQQLQELIKKDARGE